MRKVIGIAFITATMLLTSLMGGCRHITENNEESKMNTDGATVTSEITERTTDTDEIKATESENTTSDNPGDTEPKYSEVNGALGGIDALGRSLDIDLGLRSARADGSGRKVGIFYFLWQGEHGTDGPYDNNKIVKANPSAVKSELDWIASGGGPLYAHHFWGEPLFGYYTSRDTWVMRKHLQMLTDAGIDFIVIDTTNAYTYTERVKQLISVWYEYLLDGVNVPKISFYTNSSSGVTINKLYNEIYTDKELNEKYPRLSELWYNWDGKPMIVGITGDKELSAEAKNYFRIKASVWPNKERVDDGFPWMEFTRHLSKKAIYGLNGRREVVNVSMAQHSVTCVMSASAWYGANDRTRSWHGRSNDTSPDAVLKGYNFAEQWEWAIGVDPEMIFVTGWNEWVAQRQPATSKYPIYFVDCCDPNTSRDAEPMEGLFGDNYYMQLAEYIRKYKGAAPRVNVGGMTTIDINSVFEQWDNAAITARYLDYKSDTQARYCLGFGNILYKSTEGMNDIINMKVARDMKNLYFYADTAKDIKIGNDGTNMVLFISSGRTDSEKWAEQFDFAIVPTAQDSGTATLSSLHKNGSMTSVGSCRIKIVGNKIMVEVPLDLLGIPYSESNKTIGIQFKWADSFIKKDGALDVWSFYRDGDAAPMGRMTYVFSNKISEKQ